MGKKKTTDFVVEPNHDARLAFLETALWYRGVPAEQVSEHELVETVGLALRGEPVSKEALADAQKTIAHLFSGMGKPENDDDRELDRLVGEMWQALTVASYTEGFVAKGLARDEAKTASFLYVNGEG